MFDQPEGCACWTTELPNVVDELNTGRKLVVPATPGPCGPCGPVASVAPVLPVAPTGPCTPVAPVAPVLPCGPIGPVAPAGPCGPCGPAGPVTDQLIKVQFARQLEPTGTTSRMPELLFLQAK